MLVLAASLAVPLLAQTSPSDNQPASNGPVAPATTTTTTTTTTNASAAVQTAAPEETPIELSPFVVSSTEGNDSYQVTDTLAGTRVRTNLNDLGMPISVIDSKEMSDLGATDATSLLQYTTNTEVGGLYGNFAGLGNTSTLSENSRLENPSTDTRVRGLATADNTRNYFPSSIPWDNFDVDRVDMQRGPDSMLFGNGSPAGVINASLNDAMFTTQGKYENRIDQYGSMRNLLDLNYVILPDELAFRIVGLNDNEQYEQHGTYNHQKRLYAALKYDPKWLSFENAKTELRVNDEWGNVDANNPRELPPVDEITPWFQTSGANALNQMVVDPYFAHSTNAVANGTASTHGNPWIDNSGLGRIDWSNIVYQYGNPMSGALGNGNIFEAWDIGTPNGIGATNPASGLPTSTTWPVSGAIASIPFADADGIGSYSLYAQAAGLPGSQFGVYHDTSITNPSIFNFYKQTLDGPNSNEHSRWNSFNADLSELLFNDRLSFDFSYYYERYNQSLEDYLTDNDYAIGIDLNTVLPQGSTNSYVNNTPGANWTGPTVAQIQQNAPGVLNPNVGRPYVVTDGAYGNGANQTVQTSWRAEMNGDIRSTDFFSNSIVNSILGHHSVTALLASDRTDSSNWSWARWDSDQNWLNLVGGSESLNGGSRDVAVISYIGPSLLGATSASGANLQGLTTMHLPTSNPSVNYFNSKWANPLNPTDPAFVNPNAAYSLPMDTQPYGTSASSTALMSNQSENYANYTGWTTATPNIIMADNGQAAQLYDQGSKQTTIDKSASLIWQGYLFDGTIVPSFGWRQDRISLAAQTAPFLDANQSLVDPFNYTSGPVQATQQQDSRTWSIVAHLPPVLKKYLPAGLDLSGFYETSSNFQAKTIRKDFLGNIIPDPSGTTKEYGFTLSALDGRASIKFDWYNTQVLNADLTGNQLGNNSYLLYLLPTWAAAHAEIDYAGLKNLNINGVSVQGEPWFWDYSSQYGGTPYGAQPRGPAESVWDGKELAAISDFATYSLPQQFYDVYQMPISVANMQSGNWTNVITQPGWNPVTQGAGALQSGDAGTVNGTAPSATVDTVSKGVEIEIYAQPIKGWNFTLNASKDNASRQDLNKTLVELITEENTLWNSNAGQLHLWSAGGQTMQQVYDANIYGPYQNLLAQANTQAPEVRPWHVNAITDYSFSHGMLKNINVGGAFHWEQGEILGYALDPTTQLITTSRPWHGPSDGQFDCWIGYNFKLTHKIAFHTQLNIRNLGLSDKLIPIDVQPDGTPAEFRIQNGQFWQWTNTFTF
ncbi:MAG TPA: TonB-dependent receptor plug domain-containing protein [Opitutaceae bacterium]